MSSDWCTIESDPGVFTELIEKYGVEGVQFTEIYDYSDCGINSIISEFGNIYGIIFLFKFIGRSKETHINAPIEAPFGMFYAHQVINNACATQAILSILLNREDINIGPHLSELKKFSAEFDAASKGLVIGNSEVLRAAHNSFHPMSSLEISDPETKGTKGDAFHYVCYVPFGDSVYELDGLASGVVKLGKPNGNNNSNTNINVGLLYENPKMWVCIAIDEVKRRMGLYKNDDGSGEIRFSLMAVVPDKICSLNLKLKELNRKKQVHIAKLMSLNGEYIPEECNESEYLDSEDLFCDEGEIESLIAEIPDGVGEIKNEINNISLEINDKLSILNSERRIRNEWRRENERRRHDFLPFILTLIKHASKKGLLTKKISQLLNA
ncbi:hypothetical protein FG386_001200 [Cryptosporidium ryanae]|uniref:uncharacterized protein n=1 Tax=Cryptosporidium ryanae TaxID=515981 RepID=UPI003519FE09|nr:hypothetical protein FG386_001200 [Cryptosporidium ryanae]